MSTRAGKKSAAGLPDLQIPNLGSQRVWLQTPYGAIFGHVEQEQVNSRQALRMPSKAGPTSHGRKSLPQRTQACSLSTRTVSSLKWRIARRPWYTQHRLSANVTSRCAAACKFLPSAQAVKHAECATDLSKVYKFIAAPRLCIEPLRPRPE